jgi:outer membrane protein
MRTRSAAAFALAAALATAAHALDVVEVWQAARTHDPEHAAALAAHDAGGARRTQAGALWRPTVTLEGAAAYATGETSTRGAHFAAPGFGETSGVAFDTSVTGGGWGRYGLALRQPLFSRERDAQGRQLEIAADAADREWAQAEQMLILRSADVYIDVALAAERLRLLVRQQAAVERALTEAQDRFRIGDRPVTDVHEATARAAGLKAQRLMAETDLQMRRKVLADLTGLTIGEEAAGLPGAAPADDLETLPAWLARVERGNLELQAAETRIRMTEAQARVTADALAPTVDLVARLSQERLSGDGRYGSASTSATNHAIGVQLTVPLYTGGMRSAQQTEAQALIGKASAERDKARQQIGQQTQAAWLDLAVGGNQLAALAAGLEASRARLDATRTGLRAGDRTTLDLLNAENDAGNAELALREARARLLLRRLRLAALAGELDEMALRQTAARFQLSSR